MKLAQLIAAFVCSLTLFAVAEGQTAQVDFPLPAQGLYAVDFDEAGGGYAAFNDNLELVVFAFAPDGGILWQQRLADPIGFPGPWASPRLLALPDSGVLVLAHAHVVRLGSDGSVQAARQMPSQFVGAPGLCRLSDGRILVGTMGSSFESGFASPVRILEIDADGNPLGQQALTALYPNVPGGSWSPTYFDMTAMADGGWAIAHGAQSWECCDSFLAVSRHDSTGAVVWITMMPNVFGGGNVVGLASGQVVVTTSLSRMFLFSESGSLLSPYFFTTSAGTKGVAGVGATPDGGLVGVCNGAMILGQPSTLWRLDAQLNLVFARHLNVDLDGPVEVAVGPQGHISMFGRNRFRPRLVRTGAEGAWYGACAPFSPPAIGALAPSNSPSLFPTQASMGSAPIAPTNAVVTTAADAGEVTLAVCADPRPRLVPNGGQVGADLAFHHQQPGAPSGLSVLLVSASGPGSLPLPGQLDAGIQFDGVTDWVLSSGLGFVFLDGAGEGWSPPVEVPNNPGLIGFELVYGGVAVTAEGVVLQATLPRSLVLR